MSTEWQTTLARPFSLSGRGIHSGKTCVIALAPAPPDYGVRFARGDLAGKPEIPVAIAALPRTPPARHTVLCAPEDDSVRVETVEHVLAVLHGMGIDNARVEMSGPESPIWDGGAGELAEKVAESGVRTLEGSLRRFFDIERPVSFLPPDSPATSYSAWPSEKLTITYFLEYAEVCIGVQAVSFCVEPDTFRSEIAPARTFCTEEEVEALRQQGLIKGGGLENAVVVGKNGILNPGGLLWRDEPARHKMLDLIGDLFLLGSRVRGHIVSHRGGHRANAQFIQFLRKEFPHA